MKLKFAALSLISIFSLGGLVLAGASAPSAVHVADSSPSVVVADDIIWH